MSINNANNHLPLAVNQIVKDIEADIIFGQLRPYQELTEDSLMERFATKRHIVRTVIQELVNRRIVTKEHSKPARVKNFTATEVEEIYHMRALLQQNAAHIMPLPADPELMQALIAAHEQHANAVANGVDYTNIHNLNDQFHNALFKLCKNNELCKAINTYTELSNPIRSYGIIDPNWLTQAVQDHAAMVEAIKNQNRDLLKKLVVDHMQPTRKRWESLYVR